VKKINCIVEGSIHGGTSILHQGLHMLLYI